MNAAPTTAAAEPASVMPPEVPAGRVFPEMMERASPPRRVPTSVAHVSAADAARAPSPITSQTGDAAAMLARAAAVKSPPFARTCQPSRERFFATIASNISALRRAPMRERPIPARKYATRRMPQLHPAATATAPVIVAATAPLADNAFARCAANEMAPDR